MSDLLEISALKTSTRIGVHEWEQRILQPLLIDIKVPIDLSQCQDRLEHTIDYSALCQMVTTFVETHSFKLIETVAEQVAALIKAKFNISKLIIRVSKPHAIKNAANVSISITR